jgi:hypothetical protein
MGKIKSTLDIVMERTKDLTMTREDREVLEKKELTDRVRGWIQQLVDRKSTVEELKAEYAGERQGTRCCRRSSTGRSWPMSIRPQRPCMSCCRHGRRFWASTALRSVRPWTPIRIPWRLHGKTTRPESSHV